MKKILCIVPYTYLPAKTGGQKCIAVLYEGLSFYYSLVVIGTKANDVSKAAYSIKRILSSSFFRYIDPLNYFKIKKIIKDEMPEYLQIEHPYMGWLAILLQSTTGVKLIVRSHNIEGIRFKNLGKWWWKVLLKYEAWVYREATINYFISDADLLFAVNNFHIKQSKCFNITYGIDQTEAPSAEQHATAKAIVVANHNLRINDIIILFNGAFDYKPNSNALYNLVNNIFPLVKSSTRSFKLIICGKDIPDDIIASTTDKDIIFAGFVPDINVYLIGATIFVNPITEGGGIKTKLVEALGLNLTCVSFRSGAIGIPEEICGQKLLVVDDGEIEKFAAAIVEAADITSNIPASFYERFFNKKIVEKVRNIL